MPPLCWENRGHWESRVACFKLTPHWLCCGFCLLWLWFCLLWIYLLVAYYRIY